MEITLSPSPLMKALWPSPNTAYERSIAIVSDLYKASPEGATTRHRLATYTLAMGRLNLYLEEYESASAQFKKMLEIYRRPSARDAVLDAEAGPIYPMYAQALQELSHLGRAKEALQLREAYIGLLGYFAQSESDDKQDLIRLADLFVKYGISLRRDNQTDQARSSFKSALDILEAMASNDPENTELGAKIGPIKLQLSRIDQGQ